MPIVGSMDNVKWLEGAIDEYLRTQHYMSDSPTQIPASQETIVAGPTQTTPLWQPPSSILAEFLEWVRTNYRA